jgi:hypothetical protein
MGPRLSWLGEPQPWSKSFLADPHVDAHPAAINEAHMLLGHIDTATSMCCLCNEIGATLELKAERLQ